MSRVWVLNLVLAGAIVLAVALAVTLGETRFSATDYAEALSRPASGPGEVLWLVRPLFSWEPPWGWPAR